MSEDTMSAQTGPMIAARLGFPRYLVIKLDVHATGGYIRVERELEAGHSVPDLALPALIAVQSESTAPVPIIFKCCGLRTPRLKRSGTI